MAYARAARPRHLSPRSWALAGVAPHWDVLPGVGVGNSVLPSPAELLWPPALATLGLLGQHHLGNSGLAGTPSCAGPVLGALLRIQGLESEGPSLLLLGTKVPPLLAMGGSSPGVSGGGPAIPHPDCAPRSELAPGPEWRWPSPQAVSLEWVLGVVLPGMMPCCRSPGSPRWDEEPSRLHAPLQHLWPPCMWKTPPPRPHAPASVPVPVLPFHLRACGNPCGLVAPRKPYKGSASPVCPTSPCPPAAPHCPSAGPDAQTRKEWRGYSGQHYRLPLGAALEQGHVAEKVP